MGIRLVHAFKMYITHMGVLQGPFVMIAALRRADLPDRANRARCRR